jgi:hypothetical protein
MGDDHSHNHHHRSSAARAAVDPPTSRSDKSCHTSHEDKDASRVVTRAVVASHTAVLRHVVSSAAHQHAVGSTSNSPGPSPPSPFMQQQQQQQQPSSSPPPSNEESNAGPQQPQQQHGHPHGGASHAHGADEDDDDGVLLVATTAANGGCDPFTMDAELISRIPPMPSRIAEGAAMHRAASARLPGTAPQSLAQTRGAHSPARTHTESAQQNGKERTMGGELGRELSLAGQSFGFGECPEDGEGSLAAGDEFEADADEHQRRCSMSLKRAKSEAAVLFPHRKMPPLPVGRLSLTLDYDAAVAALNESATCPREQRRRRGGDEKSSMHTDEGRDALAIADDSSTGACSKDPSLSDESDQSDHWLHEVRRCLYTTITLLFRAERKYIFCLCR